MITALVGLFYSDDVVRVVLYGVIAALTFGIGGLLIGNLFHGYVMAAAKREAIDRAVVRKMQWEAAKKSRPGKGKSDEGTDEEPEAIEA